MGVDSQPAKAPKNGEVYHKDLSENRTQRKVPSPRSERCAGGKCFQ